MARDQRTRLNNMIAERAPGAGLSPGKGALTDELEEDDLDTVDDVDVALDEVVTQPAVKRSVFDSPFATDVTPTVDDDAADEAPTTKRRG